MVSQIAQVENVNTQIGKNDRIKQSQDEFVDVITEQVGKLLKAAHKLDGPFKVINYPSGFRWSVQLAPNNYYNKESLEQIDFTISEGNTDAVNWGVYKFSNLYNQIINTITYVISQDDKKIIEKELGDASSQISTVVETWEAHMGEITDEMKAEIVPPDKPGYIEHQVQELWGGDTRKIPDSLNDFKIAYQTYLVIAKKSHTILSRSAQALMQLEASKNNTEEPTKENGGMRTDEEIGKDPIYFVGYDDIPHQTTINNGLKTDKNKISINMKLYNFSSTECDLSIEGKAKISVPIADFLTFSIGASAESNLYKYTSTSTSLNITMVYPGVTFIRSTPKSLSNNRKTAWYDNLIISEAVKNADKGDTVTGFQLQGHEFPIDEYFGEGKKFSRIKTLVISQQPTITMKFKNSNVTDLTADLKEKVKIKLNILGFDVGGSISEKFDVTHSSYDSKTGEVTIIMGPPEPVGTTPMKKSTAYVLGGVASYQPNDSVNEEEFDLIGDSKGWFRPPNNNYPHIHGFGREHNPQKVVLSFSDHDHLVLVAGYQANDQNVRIGLNRLDNTNQTYNVTESINWIQGHLI